MTECERLIANGTFSPDFFKPEVRCDFLVDEKRKKIWSVEIDLLLQFGGLCNKYGLKFWLSSGSMLGAVRHKGFIPWDDDIDVIMPRADYEEMLKHGAEFLEPYFLQTHASDPECYFSFPKLRNSNTTALSEMFAWQNMNHGIFIDVYPLDDTDSVKGQQVFFKIDALNRELSTWMRRTNPTLDEANRKRVASYCGRSPDLIYNEVQALALSAAGDDEEYFAQFLSTITTYQKNHLRRKDFLETVFADFEGFKFPIPKGYDNALKDFFGDYMKFPPEEKRIGHYGSLFEPDVPFAKFVSDYRMARKGTFS